MELVLIRHTAVEGAQGLCYGRLDLPLESSSEASIAQVLAALGAVDAVVSSPASRCRRLADRIVLRDGCNLLVEPDLQELDFGAWEGLRWDAIDRAQSDPWAEDPWNRAPPGGERESRMWERVHGWAQRWRPPEGATRVALVAHGGPLRLLRCWLSGRPLEDRWDLSLRPGESVTLPWRAAQRSPGD